MKPTYQKLIFKIPFFSAVFDHLSTYLVNISTAEFPWNKTDKTPTFTGIPPHVNISTMLEAIRTSQDGMQMKYQGILLESS